MALINVLIFVVLKTFHNLVFMQKSADISMISKRIQGNIAFILNVLSGTVNVFAYICLVFEIKNAVSFLNTRFY